MTGAHRLGTIFAGFPKRPAIQALQYTAYWGTVILSAVLAGFAVWYLDRIPTRLLTEAREALTHRPWLQPLVSVNGRDLILSGTMEPTARIAQDIERLEALAGVRNVSNRLNTIPRPSPEFRLVRCADGVTLQGHLTGEDLHDALAQVGVAFSNVTVRDNVRIDDRLGSPLWLSRLRPMLKALSELECFTLIGTRDHIRMEGAVDTVSRLQVIAHQVRNGLDPAVMVSNRLWPAPDPSLSTLALIGDSGDTMLNLQTNDAEGADRLHRALKQDRAFGKEAVFNLTLDPERHPPQWFHQMAEVLPSLGLVHDLRLVSSGQGLWMWGQVPNAEVLRRLEDTLKARGLEDIVVSHLTVSPAGKSVELSLFRDRNGIILSGRLPDTASRAVLLEQLKNTLQDSTVQAFITLDADIRFNPWSIPWPTLLPLLPNTPFGLTMADDHILITGQTPSDAAHDALIHALTKMKPEMTLIDWLTLKTDDRDHDLSSG